MSAGLEKWPHKVKHCARTLGNGKHGRKGVCKDCPGTHRATFIWPFSRNNLKLGLAVTCRTSLESNSGSLTSVCLNRHLNSVQNNIILIMYVASSIMFTDHKDYRRWICMCGLSTWSFLCWVPVLCMPVWVLDEYSNILQRSKNIRDTEWT